MRKAVRRGVLVSLLGVGLLTFGGLYAGLAGLPGVSAQPPSPVSAEVPDESAAIRNWYEGSGREISFPETPPAAESTPQIRELPGRALFVLDNVTAFFPAARDDGELEARLAALESRLSNPDARPAGMPEPPQQKSVGMKSLDEFFANLDLASDFAFTFDALGVTENPSTLDLNALLAVSYNQVIPFLPNGIPDVKEILLLQQILQTEDYDRTASGGASQAATAAKWYALESTFSLAEGVESVDERVKRTVLAYCMLGDPVSAYLGLLIGVAAGWFPQSEEVVDYLLTLQEGPLPFTYFGDADGDGFSNLLEWEDAPSTYLDDAADPQTTPTGTYHTMTRTQEGSGVWPYPVEERYADGSVAMLRAIARPPWLFSHWEVTPDGESMQTSTTNPLFVTVTDDIQVHAVYVPDPTAYLSDWLEDAALEQAVRIALDKVSGTLRWADVLDGKLTALDASGLGIRDLDGIELLLDLVSLDLYNNRLTYLDNLSGLTSLQQLDVGLNRISRLDPLKPLVNLTSLEAGRGNLLTRSLNLETLPASGNLITDVSPLSGLTGLAYLGLSGNTIADVSPLAGLENVQHLFLTGNPLTDLSPLYGELPDLAILGLGGLGLNDTQMTTILSYWPDLVGLDVSENSLTSLSCAASCTGMQLLVTSRNPGLSNIAALSNFSSLQAFLANGCQITSVAPLSGLSGSGVILYLHDNQVSGLGVLASATFTDGFLNFSGNPLTQDDVCTHIPAIQARGNDVAHDSVCGASFTLTTAVSPAGAGRVQPFTGTRNVAEDATIGLQAEQTDPEYAFQSWQGDASGSDPVTHVEMTGNKSVTAVFAASNIILTIGEPSEGGSVSPAPGEWACRSGEYRCVYATPNPGWVFAYWVDESHTMVSESESYCFEATSSVTLLPLFARADWTLDITREGEGAVYPVEGRHYFRHGANVTLSAWPSYGWYFDLWTGSVTSSEPLTYVVMDRNRAVTANFGAYEGLLTVQQSGQGTLSPAPGEYWHMDGDIVTFEANPAPGWMLDRWEGALSGAGRDRSPSLATEGSQTVTAVFVQVPQTPVSFADANLEAAVRAAIEKPTGDLYLTDLVGCDPEFDTLDASSSQIVSLAGLENCLDLTSLLLSDNAGITGLGPLAYLQNLRQLSLSGTAPLSMEPLEGLLHLQELGLAGCGLSDLSFLEGMMKLTALDLSDNLVEDPEALAGLTGLQILDVSSNPLDTAGLDFAAGLVNLTYFQANDTGMSDLSPLAGLLQLDAIGLADNAITDVAALVENTGLATHGVSESDVVALEGNTLSRTALCDQIPALQARSVSITHDGTCRRYLDVTVEGQGTVSKSPDQADYAVGAQVTLISSPAAHWHLEEWQGDASGSGSSTVVTMNGDKAVTAVFAINRHTVTVTASGGGLVTLNSGQQSDGPAASASLTLDYGAEYSVAAVAEEHRHFTEWTGGLTGTQPEAQGTVSANTAITAVFSPDQHTISVSTDQEDGGEITLSDGVNSDGPDTSVSLTVDYGTVVTVTADAAEHWHFLEWTDALEGMENPAEVAVEGDLSASAVFTGDLHSITVEAVSAHQDLTLPVECLLMLTAAAESLYDGPAALVSLEDVPYGADFTVEAEPAEGWRLREWLGNGDFSGSDPVLEGTVDRDLSGTAVFARRHTLSIEVAPASGVAVDVYGPALLVPDAVTVLDAVEGRELHEYVVDRETVLFLHPHPASPGWRFMAWSGTDAASVSGNELEMDGDKSIEAVFARDWALALGENITADPEPDGNGRYLDGAEVTLTATAPEGHQFTGWTGDLSGTTNPDTLEMDGNKSVGAVFTPDTHTLTVSCDTSQGGVAVYLNGSETPATGSGGVYAVHFGDAVRLEASPLVDAGNGVWHRFAGWTGVPGVAAGSTVAGVSFTVTGDVPVTAAFQRQYKVTLSVSGAGHARLVSATAGELLHLTGDGSQPGPSDGVLVDAGTGLSVSAWVDNAQWGWSFDGWTVNGAPVTPVTAERSLGACNANLTVSAAFTRDYTLSVEVYPSSIDAEDPNAPAPGEAEVVCASPDDCGTFTATAAATAEDWRFKRWRGRWNGASWQTLGNQNPAEFTLTGNLLLRAEFEKYYLPDDFQALLTHSGFGALLHTTTVAFSGSCGGHQIPDVVYMALVDWLLDAPSVVEGNLVAAVRAAYQANMTALHTMFDTLEQEHEEYTRPDSPVLSAVAAAAVYSKSSYNTLAMLVSLRERQLLNMTGLPFPLPQDMATVEALAPCADLDGDGFSNAGEWLYFDWVYDGLLGDLGSWTPPSAWLFRGLLGLAMLEQGSPDEVPDMTAYANRPGAPPTVTVTIAREGEGGIVYPSPGTYKLPKYHLTDWWTRDAAGNYVPRADACATCAPATLGVTAISGPDSTFRHWVGGVMDISAEIPEEIIDSIHDMHLDTNPRQELLLVADYDIMARFDSTPLAALAPDLAEIVGEVYALYGLCTYEDYFSLAYDTGDVRFLANNEWVLRPDGIPDYAQFMLLQEILVNPGVNLIDTGHVCHLEIWRIFSNQHAELAAQLGSAQMDEQTRLAVAALLTMGTTGHSRAASRIAFLSSGINLDLSQFEITASRWLSANSNADGDWYDNTDEWLVAVDQAEEEISADDLVAVYAAAATDAGAGVGEQTPIAPPPRRDCAECWNSYKNLGSQVRYDDQTSANWPFETWTPVESATAATGKCDENGQPGIVALQKGSTISAGVNMVPNGEEVTMEAGEPLHGRFGYWLVPGSIMNGSLDKSLKFKNSRNSTETGVIKPVRVTQVQLWILSSEAIIHVDSCDDAVEIEHGVLVHVNGSSYDNVFTVVTGPANSEITITAEAKPLPPPLNWPRKVFGWSMHDDGDIDQSGCGYSRGSTSDPVAFVALANRAIVPDVGLASSTRDPRSKRLTFRTDVSNARPLAGERDARFVGSASTWILGIGEVAPVAAMSWVPKPGYVFDQDSLVIKGSLDIFNQTWENATTTGNCVPLFTLHLQPKLHADRATGAPTTPDKCVGQVVATPASRFYDEDKVITLQAQPFHGYEFYGWRSDQPVTVLTTGATVGTALPATQDTHSTIQVKLSGTTSIEAHFRIMCYHLGEDGTANKCPNDAYRTVGCMTQGKNVDAGQNSRTGLWIKPASDGNTERYACAHYAVHVLRTVAEQWNAEHPNAQPVQVTALSIENGGSTVHQSHQNGLDIDVRYVRKTSAVNNLNLRNNFVACDTELTRQLVDLFNAQQQVINVKVSSLLDWEVEDGIVVDNGTIHDNHFHVNLRDPDGDDDCTRSECP